MLFKHAVAVAAVVGISKAASIVRRATDAEIMESATVSVTSLALVTEGKNMCAEWQKQCDVLAKATKGGKSVTECQPLAEVNDITVAIKAACAVRTGADLAPATAALMMEHSWSDSKDEAVYEASYAAASNNLTLKFASPAEEQLSYKKYVDELKSTADKRELKATHAIWQKWRETSIYRDRVYSFKEFLALSELERQVIVNRDSARWCEELRPYPKTAARQLAWLNYRDVAFKKHGYYAIEKTIEDFQAFIRKKSEGVPLTFQD